MRSPVGGEALNDGIRSQRNVVPEIRMAEAADSACAFASPLNRSVTLPELLSRFGWFGDQTEAEKVRPKAHHEVISIAGFLPLTTSFSRLLIFTWVMSLGGVTYTEQ